MQAPQRQALFPGARQGSGKLLLAPLERTQSLDRFASLLLGVGQAVEVRHEFQVLADRKILVERKALRHVADARLDQVALGANVVAKARAVAGIGGQQPAQHADGRGLARTVGPQKSIDLTALHMHGEVLDDGLVAEGFRQSLDLDGDFRGVVNDGTTGLKPGLTILPPCSR